MTTMAGRFRRTITFPEPGSKPSGGATVATKRSSYRNRSSSLPVRFHPIISDLDDDVASLRSWSESRTTSPQPRSSLYLLDGADLISIVLASLSDLLSHPQAADPLRNSPITDPFLDDLMRLADSYDIFRISLINLSHHQAETQAALRRWDSPRLTSAVRAQRQAGKDIIRLATKAKAAAKTKPMPLLEPSVPSNSSGVDILPVVFCDATFALAAASAELISGLAALSNEAIAPIAPVIATGGPVKLLKIWWIVDLLRWKSRARKRAMERKKEGGFEGRMERKVAMEKLVGLENCITALESSSDKVFRALVNARVTVLNILTPSI